MRDKNMVLCSTGIITHYPNYPSHRSILECWSKIHADHYELMIYPNWYERIDEIIADFSNEDITFPVVHADKRFGTQICEAGSREYRKALETFAVDCDIANQVGADFIVVHLWGLPCSDRNFGAKLTALGECIRIAERFDVGVSVEPIYCSIRDPLTNACDIHDADWIWDMKPQHFHVNDYAGPAYNMGGGRHPGHGQIDFDRLFTFLSNMGFTGTFTLEAVALDENGQIQYGKLNSSLDFLARRVARLNNGVDAV